MAQHKFLTIKHQIELNLQLNLNITNGFLLHKDDPNVSRTHLFNDRYENIYLNETHIPELRLLLKEACSLAEKILDRKNIRAGYWFNYMLPGAITIPHTHNDDDELLSAVYYVSVPEDSGNLILQHKNKRELIKPEEGLFVFFAPDVVHEVTENKSDKDRLSIGINFGPDN